MAGCFVMIIIVQ